MIRTVKLILSLIILLFLIQTCSNSGKTIHVYCTSQNDLFKILNNQEKLNVILYDSPQDAVDNALNGSAVLLLADDYPQKQLSLSDNLFKEIHKKQLCVYIEYPDYLPDLQPGQPVTTSLKRAVVNSSFFGEFLDSLQILSINGLNYVPFEVESAHIVAARVAGFDHALFGLPEETSPLLFELPGYRVLVSTTKLSQFVTGRYAPQEQWGNIWNHILSYLTPGTEIQNLNWEPVFGPSYGREERLPENYQKESIKRGIDWFYNARMLVHESYDDTIEMMIQNGNERLTWDASIPIGDGSNGVLEFVASTIDEKGSQPIGIIKRGDCNSESAMAFASTGTLMNEEKYHRVAENLLDFYLINSKAIRNEYGDPKHPAFGLIPWGISNYAWYKASYGDDNARFLLSALTTASFTGTDRWNETFMRSLLALLRTTGTNGFRGNRIDLEAFEKNGWEHYYNRDIINIKPHFEAYAWACMLWAYNKTKDPIFLERTEKAIQIAMKNYPDGWKWTNGLAQEKARMILPLAWLLRIKDTPENRQMLYNVMEDLIALQHKTGAIREEIGDLTMGVYPPPRNNEDYGTNEASLIARNGDQVCDLLYTTNFAFLGLHEAYYATKDPEIKAATDRLAEFLCRIQVASEEHPEIDGGWMRAFDFGRYEHWGSNADHGWGAWAIESGWTQSWIISILALREMDTSIWDLTENLKVDQHFIRLKDEMLH